MARNEKFGRYPATHRHPCDAYGCRKPGVSYIGKGDVPYERFYLCKEHDEELTQSIMHNYLHAETPAAEVEAEEEVVTLEKPKEVEEILDPGDGFPENEEPDNELSYTHDNLISLSKKELQAIADELGVEYNSRTTNTDLMNAIIATNKEGEE